MSDCPLKYVCIQTDKCQDCLSTGIGYVLSKQYIPMSNIPKAYAPTEYNPVPMIKSLNYDLRKFAQDIKYQISKGNGIYLWSTSTGTGKTSVACLLLLKALKYLWYQAAIDEAPTPVMYFNVVELLDKLRSNMNTSDERFSTLWSNQFTELAPKIILLDDIGAEKPSEWVMERLYSLINYRVANGLSTLYTSNYSPDKLEGQLGSRIASRVFSTKNLVVRMEEIDRRRADNG